LKNLIERVQENTEETLGTLREKAINMEEDLKMITLDPQSIVRVIERE